MRLEHVCRIWLGIRPDGVKGTNPTRRETRDGLSDKHAEAGSPRSPADVYATSTPCDVALTRMKAHAIEPASMSVATRQFFLGFVHCRATTRLKQTAQPSELLMGTLLLYKGRGTKGGGDLQQLNYHRKNFRYQSAPLQESSR